MGQIGLGLWALRRAARRATLRAMRRTSGLIHLIVCCVLIWQGAAGALASGRMAFDATAGGAICRPGGSDPRAADPQAAIEHALCSVHCGAVVGAPPPFPLRLAARLPEGSARHAAAPRRDAPRARLLRPSPARDPPAALLNHLTIHAA